MSAIVTELFEDRIQTIESSGKYKSLELVYMARNIQLTKPQIFINNVAYPATTEWFALEAVRAHAPRVVYGMTRKELHIIAKIDENSYKIGVNYEYTGIQRSKQQEDNKNDRNDNDDADNDRDVGDRTITFSSSGGTRHITHSFMTMRVGTAPSQNGAINVDNNNNINGVDVLAPTLTFTETHHFTYKKFTVKYIRDLNSLQGKINKATFRGFNAGEVRFDGFSATRRGSKRDDLYEITFQFSVIPNQEEQTIQGFTIPAKIGWDYVWFRTKPVAEEPRKEGEDGDGGDKKTAAALANVIEGAYIERIYQVADFGKLQIKTTPFTPVEPESIGTT